MRSPFVLKLELSVTGEILIHAFPGAFVAEAGNRDEALKHLAEGRFDLLLPGLNMFGNSGLNVLHELKRRHPRLHVVILSVQREDPYAMRCSGASAAACIKNDRAPEDLTQATKIILERHSQVQLFPGATRLGSMLFLNPLTGSEPFQFHAIDSDMVGAARGLTIFMRR
jgi:DNA-binding NarL/FixJ family response regulator